MNDNKIILRTEIISAARSWIGTPYRHQASIRGIGCDCLGLVRGVWREVVGEEPEKPKNYSPDWAEAGGAEQLAGAASRHLIEIGNRRISGGEILLFRWRRDLPAKHVAIATNAEFMVHAHDGAQTCEVSIAPWWRRRLASVFAFPGMDDAR